MNMFIVLGISASPPVKKVAATMPTASASASNQNDAAHTVNPNQSAVTAVTASRRRRCAGSA